MSKHREALEKVLQLCAGSTTYTNRIQQIHDVAMRGLGMTLNQRATRHNRIAQKSKDTRAVLRVAGWRAAQEKFAELSKGEQL